MGTHSTAELREEFGGKVERGIFEPVRRFLKVEQDDRLQEGVGITWEKYLRKEEKTGELLDDALCVHICKLNARDPTRHLVRPGTHSLRDACDQRNYRRGRTEVLRLDGLLDEETGTFNAEGDRELELLGLMQHLSTDPEERIHSAIDLQNWQRSLDADDVELLNLRRMGHTIKEIAEVTGLPMKKAFDRLRDLGYELANRAEIVVKKKQRKPRSNREVPALAS